MSYDDWKDDFDVAFINGIRQYDNDGDGTIDEICLAFDKIQAGTLYANTPYVIRAKSTGSKELVVEDTTLYPAEENSISCSTTIALYTFTGTYHTIAAEDCVGWYSMGGGDVRRSTGGNTMNPNRWYLIIESLSPMFKTESLPASIRIQVDGEDEEIEGIETVGCDSSTNTWRFDLNGRRMDDNNPQKGIYIENNQKSIVK